MSYVFFYVCESKIHDERPDQLTSDILNLKQPLGGGNMNYHDFITIEPGKRSGKPCIRGLRITVYDVLDYLASGMSKDEILDEFDYLTAEDIQACLAYAADRERQQLAACG